MRSGVGICLLTLAAVAVTLTLAASTSAASYPGPRNKPRTIRGFKNVALSTARGFGKRGFPALELLTAGENDDHTDRNVESLPVEWFIEELTRSPELARMIVDKFLDINQDGQLSADELLRPVY